MVSAHLQSFNFFICTTEWLVTEKLMLFLFLYFYSPVFFRAAVDSVTTTKVDKNVSTVKLKKAVLAPTFAANSPKKSTQSASGR